MFAIDKIPTEVDVTTLDEIVCSRPNSLWGKEIRWLKERPPTLVYITCFDVGKGRSRQAYYLLGARYRLEEAVIGGKAGYPGAYFVEYIVARWDAAKGWRVHRLWQRGGTTYCEVHETCDCVRAEDVTDPSELSLQKPPRWKVSEAWWPTHQEKPMRFVGQVELPEADITREYLGWGKSIYVFVARAGDKELFKITTQPTNLQTAEEHYDEEEGRWIAEGN